MTQASRSRRRCCCWMWVSMLLLWICQEHECQHESSVVVCIKMVNAECKFIDASLKSVEMSGGKILSACKGGG